VLIGISLPLSPCLSWHAKYYADRIYRVRDIVNVVRRRDKVLKRTETRGAYRAEHMPPADASRLARFARSRFRNAPRRRRDLSEDEDSSESLLANGEERTPPARATRPKFERKPESGGIIAGETLGTRFPRERRRAWRRSGGGARRGQVEPRYAYEVKFIEMRSRDSAARKTVTLSRARKSDRR